MQLLPPSVVRGDRASCGASSEADSAAAMTPCSLLDSAMINSRASGGQMWIEVFPTWPLKSNELSSTLNTPSAYELLPSCPI